VLVGYAAVFVEVDRVVEGLEPFVHVEVVAGPVGVSPLLTQPEEQLKSVS
jgi:hypothetical protein